MYVPSGSMNTYAKNGGIVIYLNNKTHQANQTFKDLFDDSLINRSLGCMTIDMAMYNPNYKKYILTSIYFMLTNSGLIEPETYYKAFRLNNYATGVDYLRAVLEVIFTIYIVISIY
jgi:hypothetical protein